MIDTIGAETPPATATDYESGPDDDQGAGLCWVAVFLIDLSYGGPEEGGWWYQTGILAIDPWVYETLGAAPAGFCTIAAANVHAEQMRVKLPEVNQGRPDISQTNSVGQYDVRVMRAQIMPTHFPRIRPLYE